MTAIDVTAVPTLPSAGVATGPGSRLHRFASLLNVNALRAALVLAGANTLFTGLNRAFGGIATLGWQGSTEFLTVLSEHDYLIQDNHNRFLGGVWAGIGLMLIVAPLDLARFRPILNFIFALIFIGGLSRFTIMRADVVFGPDIVVSLIAELVGMPLLFFWLARVLRSPSGT
jgi:hypothetical protein